MTTENTPTHFAAHCEMQDASADQTGVSLAPAAASIELAKLITRFETEIDDEWRAVIIKVGGVLLELDRQIRAGAIKAVE